MNKIIIEEIELIKENCIGKLLDIFEEIEEVKKINKNNILLLKINIEQDNSIKKCKICGRDFNETKNRNCQKCFYIHKCKNCNKLFINNKVNSIMCSNKCSAKFKTKPKYCDICNKITLRSANGICVECDIKERTKSKYCKNCKKITKRDALGQCIICHTKEKMQPKYCDICKADTFRNVYGKCIKCWIKKMTKPKFCSECNKITNRTIFGNCVECVIKPKYCNKCKTITNRNSWGNCAICATKEKMQPKYCDKCDKITKRNAFGLCIECVIKPKFCKECNKITKRNATGQCTICYPPNSFNRDKFYSSKLKLVSFKSDNKIITLEDIDLYKLIPGVWSIFGLDENNKEICLDVCETQDIGNEMLKGLRLISEGKNNLGKTDKAIKKSRFDYSYNDSFKRIKYRNIVEYKNIIFKLVLINIETKDERWKIESQYAHDNKAKFWNLAPGQNINFKNKLDIKLYKNNNIS